MGTPRRDAYLATHDPTTRMCDWPWSDWDWLWAEDLLTGSALPVLHDLAAQDGWATTKTALVGVGGLLAWAVRALRPDGGGEGYPLMDLAFASLLLVADVALLFRKAHLLDPGVGASLCAIPVFVLLCMHGADSPCYALRMRALTCLLALVVFVYSFAEAGLPDLSDTPPSATALQLFLLLTDACFACWRSGWVRCVLYLCLALARPILRPLLGLAPAPLFFFQALLLLYSALLHAGAVRTALARVVPPNTVRRVLLLHSVLLTVAFKFQWHHPQWGSYAVLGLMGAGGCLWGWELAQ